MSKNGIDGYEDAPSRLQAVALSRDLVHFLQSKVLRLRAGREFLQPKIDGICPEMERRKRRLRSARRRQQFDLPLADRFDFWKRRVCLAQLNAIGSLWLQWLRRISLRHRSRPYRQRADCTPTMPGRRSLVHFPSCLRGEQGESDLAGSRFQRQAHQLLTVAVAWVAVCASSVRS